MHLEAPLLTQGYTVTLWKGILKDEDDLTSAKTAVHLIDTAYDDTFVVGADAWKVTTNKTDTRGMDEREGWSFMEIVTGAGHTTTEHPFEPSLTNTQLEEIGMIRQIKFMDGCTAQLGLLPQPKTWMMLSHDWRRSQCHELFMPWQFGVAFAIDIPLLDDYADGILGLGLNE
ncbi:uncharacterized protein C8Q71DRAFT_288845 [Rhodofomes roseus]|uniref:Uncharacterized protein n=1 Tax=Rhodofomes roseus TaxID=34475 RepID=A0ABQ8K3V3_9APHY|nr:uncharacterized protein C8Q71DRAFT_288845 [Rhodofomes roseus]KAH9831510.1 hypothetical protein C8Q71DRAFT_288845 [Rhodofomes roseus]